LPNRRKTELSVRINVATVYRAPAVATTKRQARDSATPSTAGSGGDSGEGRGAKSYHVPAVARALSIIEFLADYREPQGVSAIARGLGIPKSSCFTILSTLESEGYVEPILESLRDKTGLTTQLALFDGRTVRYALKVEPPQSFVRFNTDPGHLASWHLTAAAKAVAAMLPRNELETALRNYKFEGGTERAARSRSAYNAQLDRTRELGYALEDQEETMGVRCVAAPVVDASGRCVGAISVTGLVTQLDVPEQTAVPVVRAAQALSARL
jgi:DNA-binding IclR family transcriptional regulator